MQPDYLLALLGIYNDGIDLTRSFFIVYIQYFKASYAAFYVYNVNSIEPGGISR